METEGVVDSEEAEEEGSGRLMVVGSEAAVEAGALPEAAGEVEVEAVGAEEASEEEGKSWWSRTDMKACSSAEVKKMPW